VTRIDGFESQWSRSGIDGFNVTRDSAHPVTLPGRLGRNPVHIWEKLPNPFRSMAIPAAGDH
jgi:hypothetical protein